MTRIFTPEELTTLSRLVVMVELWVASSIPLSLIRKVKQAARRTERAEARKRARRAKRGES